jgi:hypothetical protein
LVKKIEENEMDAMIKLQSLCEKILCCGMISKRGSSGLDASGRSAGLEPNDTGARLSTRSCAVRL